MDEGLFEMFFKELAKEGAKKIIESIDWRSGVGLPGQLYLLIILVLCSLNIEWGELIWNFSNGFRSKKSQTEDLVVLEVQPQDLLYKVLPIGINFKPAQKKKQGLPKEALVFIEKKNEEFLRKKDWIEDVKDSALISADIPNSHESIVHH
jgi:hypothetical protein